MLTTADIQQENKKNYDVYLGNVEQMISKNQGSILD